MIQMPEHEEHVRIQSGSGRRNVIPYVHYKIVAEPPKMPQVKCANHCCKAMLIQLAPNVRGSSSKISIKATKFRIKQAINYTKVNSREYINSHFIHSEQQRKFFITNQFEKYGNITEDLHLLHYISSQFSENINTTANGTGHLGKAIRDVTLDHWSQPRLRIHSIQQTIQEVACKAKLYQQLTPQSHHLKQCHKQG